MRWQRALPSSLKTQECARIDYSAKEPRTSRWTRDARKTNLLVDVAEFSRDGKCDTHKLDNERLILDLEKFMVETSFNGKIVRNGTAAISLKTLILLVDRQPIAVVLPSEARVDFHKVVSHLGISQANARLAPRDSLPQLCGFPLGAVPPIGHAPKLRTLVDRGTFSGEVAGGCGDPQKELLTTWEDLLKSNRCEPANITC